MVISIQRKHNSHGNFLALQFWFNLQIKNPSAPRFDADTNYVQVKWLANIFSWSCFIFLLNCLQSQQQQHAATAAVVVALDVLKVKGNLIMNITCLRIFNHMLIRDSGKKETKRVMTNLLIVLSMFIWNANNMFEILANSTSTTNCKKNKQYIHTNAFWC